MKDFEIRFDDLKEEVQQELLEFFEIKTPEEANWDIFPITTIIKN